MFPRKFIPTALALWIGFSPGSGRGQDSPPLVAEPGRLALQADLVQAANSQNQLMADTIAERLQRSGILRGYRVDIRFADGLAELSGTVADPAQRAEVVRIARSTAGVENVRDVLEVKSAGVLQTGQGPMMAPEPTAEMLAPRPAAPGEADNPYSVMNHRRPPFREGTPEEPMSIMGGVNMAVPPPTMQQPPMPPNAWPAFAPYNNYSRVAYPTLYKHDAFPFIGPMYPFPKVPLGWRAITLQWQDGFWWYGKKATGHDWWRIRYY